MYLGGRGGEVAGGVARAHTPLEQLLDEIKFQRRKELRSFSQVGSDQAPTEEGAHEFFSGRTLSSSNRKGST